MHEYQIKNAAELTTAEIALFLTHWNVGEWLSLTPAEFREKFTHSGFRMLKDADANTLSLARINNNFNLEIDKKIFRFAELVGLVSVERNKGYGRELLNCIKAEMRAAGVPAIGFCERQLRPFYNKCGVQIIYDKARSIFERVGDGLQPSTDDDILVLNLSEDLHNVLNALDENRRAYLV